MKSIYCCQYCHAPSEYTDRGTLLTAHESNCTRPRVAFDDLPADRPQLQKMPMLSLVGITPQMIYKDDESQ